MLKYRDLITIFEGSLTKVSAQEKVYTPIILVCRKIFRVLFTERILLVDFFFVKFEK